MQCFSSGGMGLEYRKDDIVTVEIEDMGIDGGGICVIVCRKCTDFLCLSYIVADRSSKEQIPVQDRICRTVIFTELCDAKRVF